jgi:hypothetical protein
LGVALLRVLHQLLDQREQFLFSRSRMLCQPRFRKVAGSSIFHQFRFVGLGEAAEEQDRNVGSRWVSPQRGHDFPPA